MENNLTTLGKRENAVFILTPLYLVLFHFFREFYMESGGSFVLMVPYMICWVVAVVSVLRFFRRIILPSKIIEYDSMHLYINRGLKGTEMIPWTDVKSVDNLQVHGIKNAREVRNELHKIISSKRRKTENALRMK